MTMPIVGPHREEEEGRTFTTLESATVVETPMESTVNMADVDPNAPDTKNAAAEAEPEIEQKKYYRQAFKKQWMTLPEFKEWLCPAPGNKFAAYCRFCKNTLRAHKLSLTKHIATWKHQKKSRLVEESGELENDAFMDWNTKSIQTQCSRNDTANDDDDDDDYDSFRDDGDDRSDGENEDRKTVAQVKIVEVQKPPPPKGPLTTHVLDTSRGLPAAGLSLSLYKLIDSKWVLLSEGMTNSQGRFTDFMESSNLNIGRYKMHFDVDRYFELRRQECFYPFVEIIFDIKNPNDTYHVPLLLSPYSYTTFRGS